MLLTQSTAGEESCETGFFFIINNSIGFWEVQGKIKVMRLLLQTSGTITCAKLLLTAICVHREACYCSRVESE